MTDTDEAIPGALLHRIPACRADACGQDARNCPCKPDCMLPDEPLVTPEQAESWPWRIRDGLAIAVIFGALAYLIFAP